MLGFITNLLGSVGGVGDTVKKVAEVFTENKEEGAKRADAALDRETRVLISAQKQFAREFHKPTNIFDSIINGLNRLPRPLIALGSIGVLGYAFYDPANFTLASTALAIVPEELWWLISAVVAFYFGARHFEKKAGVKADLEMLTALLKQKKAEPKREAPKAQGKGASALFEE